MAKDHKLIDLSRAIPIRYITIIQQERLTLFIYDERNIYIDFPV